ncbi:MAG: type II CRISPR RNA-guided endonuclease Cas9 [Bacteroidales bacterium]|nr:type II CRISPR RNA-guided endonuclease Cas9 [Bacteroidales bacterium]
MSKVVGLDLGTNSIGWAVVENEERKILAAGSRIIPMDAGRMSDFEKGNSVSLTADRRGKRGSRRLYERRALRRSRLLRVLRILNFLPEHYAAQLDRYGNLPADGAPRLAWREGKDGQPEFLFRSSFLEMAEQFRAAGHTGPLPYDWTLYYLRDKALSAPIAKEELAWILLQMNQKRGYNQLRGKDEEALSDKGDKEYCELLVVAIDDSGEKSKKGVPIWRITLENGWQMTKATSQKPDWEGQRRPFIATYKLDKEGHRRDEMPTLSSPQSDDWGLRKIKTEHDIQASGFTLGQFIYQSLLHDPQRKVIGDRVQTVDRSLYREELHRLLDSQARFHPELRDNDSYRRCVEELYSNNEAHQRDLANRNLTHLLAEDILLYQRPLKSKRHLIANCPYEKRHGRPIKCIAKSHPLYQEFRLWQFLSNLHIYRYTEDITATLLSDDEAYAKLYDFLATQKNIDQQGMLKHLGLKKEVLSVCRWNYVADRSYPMGETRATLLSGFRKAGIDEKELTAERELHLWHLMYSVDDQQQYRHALRTFATRQNWDDERTEAFASAFDRLTLFKEKDYGAYSHRALTRLVPLMRRGHHWSAEAIDDTTRQHIEHLTTGEVDETLKPHQREYFRTLSSVDQCHGLETWQACYLVYGRHSDAADTQPWTEPADIDRYLEKFRQHSLNNPIVEQVVTESLRVVRDIWKQHGKPDEIHIELGRELKKTAAEREALSRSIAKGEETNQRIRMLLNELKNPDCGVEGVRPQSPSQQELLKIYEEGALSSAEMTDDIKDIHDRLTDNKRQPSHAEVLRYKIWLDQKYISPYTGQPIPLACLFTPAYEIEHVIPQSRFFDDSMSNKVICEAEVNRLKGRLLGHEFITQHHEQIVPLSGGGTVRVLSKSEYEQLVQRLFATHPAKLRKLMLDDIPDDFNARQMVDSRYISRLMMHLLSNIVRTTDEEGNTEQAVTARNVIPCTGAITDRLKHEWGIGDVWNRIILPRFQRMNTLSDDSYTATTDNGHEIPSVPLDLRQGFNKKRIDHRHHAMDAIVIACTTRNHINLLNNEAAGSRTRYDLQVKLRHTEPYLDAAGNRHEKFTNFIKPWPTFTEDVERVLKDTVVSIKQNLRVINKTSNYYTTVIDGKRTTAKQQKGDSWAIRKPMHQDTVYGKLKNLRLTKSIPVAKALQQVDNIVNGELKAKIKEKKRMHYTDRQIADYLAGKKDLWSEAANGKIEVYYNSRDTADSYFAVRKPLSEIFSKTTTTTDAEKKINEITDSGIRAILLAHLTAYGGNAAEAFSPEGLEQMNLNIQELNGGKPHMPIKRVRTFERASKFPIGQTGQKATKYVEAAKGTYLFIAIFRNSKGKRSYASVPLKLVIDLQKEHEKQWQQHLAHCLQAEHLVDANTELLYVLSPNDLVYVPADGEQVALDKLDRDRIYKVVSCDGGYVSCVPANSASPIRVAVEYESLNKMKTTLDKQQMIREVCLPLKVDRLGNIIGLVDPLLPAQK